MFDTQECIEVEDKSAKVDEDGCGRSCRDKHDLRGNKNALNRRQNGAACSEEDIELQEMGGHGGGDLAAGELLTDDVADQNRDGAGQSTRRQSKIDEAVSSGAFVQGGTARITRASRMSNEDDDEGSTRHDERAYLSNSISEGMATFGI